LKVSFGFSFFHSYTNFRGGISETETVREKDFSEIVLEVDWTGVVIDG
jgi:hypothetical protein